MPALSIAIKTEFKSVPFAAEQTNHLMLELTGDAPESKTERPALDIIALVDVSGSMSSSRKMENVKESLKLLVEHMGPRDFLTIITFNPSASVGLPRTATETTAKSGILNRISTFTPQGGTNFSGALALAHYEASQKKDGDCPVKRMIFFTDGCPTVGNTDPNYLIKACGRVPKGWVITTMGYGRPEGGPQDRGGGGGDIDLDLLEKMADAGHGGFYYVENGDSAARAFGRELGGLLTTVAQNIRVACEALSTDIVVESVLEEFEVEDKSSRLIARIPDLLAEETKLLTFALVHKALHGPRTNDRPALRVTVAWQDLSSARMEQAAFEVVLQRVSPQEADRRPDPEVAAEIAVVAAIRAQEQAYELALAGRYGRAYELLKSAIQKLAQIKTPRAKVMAEGLLPLAKTLRSERDFLKGRRSYKLSTREASTQRSWGGALSAVYSTSHTLQMENLFSQSLDPDHNQSERAPGAAGGSEHELGTLTDMIDLEALIKSDDDSENGGLTH